ncbi:MAG: APC family permease, partial [Micrococcales bacterium]|nr:APC family permease [Micrococcales bacterium]
PRKIGRLVVVSVFMAVAFYGAIIVSTSMALPASELMGLKLVTADAFAALTGSAVWGKVVIAGGLAGIITSWIAFLMGASRLLWAMANSGTPPRWFGKMHPRHRTPVNALLFIGVLSAIAPFFGAPMLNWAVDASSPLIVLTYGLVAVTFVILRRTQPQMDRPLRIGGKGRGGVVIGGVAAVLCAALQRRRDG